MTDNRFTANYREVANVRILISIGKMEVTPVGLEPTTHGLKVCSMVYGLIMHNRVYPGYISKRTHVLGCPYGTIRLRCDLNVTDL